MIPNKILEIPVTSKYPLQVAMNKTSHANAYIKENVIRKCIDGVYVLAVNNILEISDLYINQGITVSATYAIRVDVKAYVCAKHSIVVNMKCVGEGNNVTKLQTEIYDTANILPSIDRTLIQAMRPGQFLPIRIDNVQYMHKHPHITVLGYSLFVPITLNVAINAATNICTEAEVTILRKKLTELSTAADIIDTLTPLIYGNYKLEDTDIDLTDMTSAQMYTLANKKTWTLLPPHSKRRGRIYIRPYTTSAQVFNITNIRVILENLITYVATLRQFAIIFSTKQLIDSHAALWNYYKTKHILK